MQTPRRLRRQRGSAWPSRRRATLLAVLGAAVLAACGGEAASSPPAPAAASTQAPHAATAAYAPSSRAPREVANVLLVSIDTLRADSLECYGYDRQTAPHLAGLAAQGALFEQAIATSDWTLPAHCSLFTGLYPSTHRVETQDDTLDEARGTLGQDLLARGYRTEGYVTNPFLDARFGYARGMQVWAHPTVRTIEPAGTLAGARAGFRTSHPRIRARDYWFDQTSAWVADRGIDFLRQSGHAAPFFLFLHFNDVHADYIPPAPYDEMFDPGWNGDLVTEDYPRNAAIHAGMDSRDLAHVKALYDGEIRSVDEHLGRVLAALDALDLARDTLVMVTADHGEGFFEHGEKEHRKGLFRELVHVPWVVRYPGRVRAGQRVTSLASQADVAPTLLGLLGADGLPDAEGVDWSAVLRDGAAPPVRVGVRSQCLISPEGGQPAAACFSLRTPSFTVLTHWRDGASQPVTQVFDCRADPQELTPLADTDPACADARARLASVRDEAAQRSRALPHVGTQPPADDDAALLERMRAMGYIR